MSRETRSQLIWRHVRAFVPRGGVSWPTYATTVREVYHELVPEPARLVHFSNHRDSYERGRLDAQTLRRLAHDYTGSTSAYDIPSDMEEAMVQALGRLNYPGYGTLMVELAERYGMLAAYIPAGTAQDDVGSVAAILKEVGEALQAAAPVLADDNAITADDDPRKLRELHTQLLEALAAVAKVEARVAGVIEQQAVRLRAVR